MDKAEKKEKNPSTEYHNTFLLLSKYRDVVWSLEISTKKMESRFIKEMGCNIEEYLDSVYLAGFDFSESGVQERTKEMEQSAYMLKLIEVATETLRKKHKHGELYYWILYYSFLSPHQYRNTEEILKELVPHVDYMSYKTFFRKRKEAIEALSMVLWGYSANESVEILSFFAPKISEERK